MKITKPGIYPSLPNDFYHASDGISKSGLDVIAKNPAKYYFNKFIAPPRVPTAAMVLGSLTHTLVFEPEQFDKEYILSPDFNRRTKQGKADELKFKEANCKKQIITPKEYTEATAISTSVINHPYVASILSHGEAETSYYAIDDETGELVKVRPDWAREDLLFDLKTCQDASKAAFHRDILNRRYHVQAAMYRHVVNLALRSAGMEPLIRDFVFIAVEKEEPYEVAVHKLGPLSMAQGMYLYREAMEVYAKCKADDFYHGYNEGKIAEIEIPRYGLNKSLQGAY